MNDISDLIYCGILPPITSAMTESAHICGMTKDRFKLPVCSVLLYFSYKVISLISEFLFSCLLTVFLFLLLKMHEILKVMLAELLSKLSRLLFSI